jgi:hypothetical protein
MANGKLSHGQRRKTMKVQTILKKMYKACISHDKVKEKKLWLKALKKSLKHKHTEVIR